MTIRFIALDPDPPLTALLWSYKERTRSSVGSQLYLDDPPHLTVYLAAFPEHVSLTDHLAPIASELPAPTVHLTGWHVFAADALTGLNTLTCQMEEADKEKLRDVQARVVETVSRWRDPEATQARYANRWDQLTEDQRQNVLRAGFPYLGAGWIPHFTVASIKPDDWPALWRELEPDPPIGKFRCTRLKEYELIDNKPRLVGSMELGVG